MRTGTATHGLDKATLGLLSVCDILRSRSDEEPALCKSCRAMGNHQREEQLRAFLAEYPADLRRKVQEMEQVPLSHILQVLHVVTKGDIM